MIAHLRGKLISDKAAAKPSSRRPVSGYDVRHLRSYVYGAALVAPRPFCTYNARSAKTNRLFGFLELQEKRLFERLINGERRRPQAGIKMLSGTFFERTVQAIRARTMRSLRAFQCGKKAG